MRTLLIISALLTSVAGFSQSFLHPGLLQKESDFDRIRQKIRQDAEPWVSGWKVLEANSHAQANYKPRPVSIVYRGYDGVHKENYALLYNDIAAAYALAIRWKISEDTAFANAAVQILNGWADSLTALEGTNDRVLAAGLYGYELANAAEIMRTYPGWDVPAFDRFRQMMKNVFYTINHQFLTRTEGCMTHFYANWDLCNMDAVMAIGVLCDDRSMYNEAIGYFKNGPGNGNILKAVNVLYGDSLGQWQESGRDQGHTQLGIGEMGALCEMAWNQGDDLYGYDNNRFLKGAEYVARYNLGDSVPYTEYTNCAGVDQPVISATARGSARPVWELVYNHYVRRRGLQAPNCARMAAALRPEGGGGNYGPNSGGFDQLGYGTLLYTLEP
ncbi:alginate lyase family protein [Dinghuibacter silviterrae]|uniref:Alginate lyase n=1 Tax=Dinghuibacter silviterrae TaxID=1539049 RepID=A0A4R8DI52_9BACT|nr:alginate lyase family protein [Dinghuibacter silviterrae]TDW96974.1 alginate lyase [Dinghuibacter silviterrae]